MKRQLQVIAAAAGSAIALVSASAALGSTLSKNTPGAIRHPIHEAAKALGLEKRHKHHTSSYQYSTYQQSYTTGHYRTRSRSHRHTRHRSRHHRRY